MLSKLSVQGSKIIDALDRTILLRGAGWQDLSFNPTSAVMDAETRAKAFKSYGANSVRLWLNWRLWKHASLGEAYKVEVDKCVQACENNNLYVFFSMMGFSYPIGSNDPAEKQGIVSDPTEWINWMNDLLTRYQNTNVIGFSIWNEPTGVSETGYRNAIKQACQSIQNIHPEALIFIDSWGDGGAYGRGIDPYWINNPLPQTNIVHCFHRYYCQDVNYRDQTPDYVASYEAGNYAKAKQELEQAWQSIVFDAMDAGMCCMHEEFGYNPNRPEYPEPASSQVQSDIYEMMNRRGLHWNYVAWWPGGYGLLSNWTANTYTLSLQGEKWAEKLTSISPQSYMWFVPAFLIVGGVLFLYKVFKNR